MAQPLATAKSGSADDFRGLFNTVILDDVEDMPSVLAVAKSNQKKDTNLGVNAANVAQVNYVLEVYRDGKLDSVAAFPLQPAYKDVQKGINSSVRFTLGKFPIREHTEDRLWSLTYGGMTGIQVKKYVNRDGKTLTASGIKRMKSFDKFLANYQVLAQTEGSLYLTHPTEKKRYEERTYMMLRDFDEGIHYRVEGIHFDWNRAGDTRVANANWKLSLQAYSADDITARPPNGAHASAPLVTPPWLQGAGTGTPTLTGPTVLDAKFDNMIASIDNLFTEGSTSTLEPALLAKVNKPHNYVLDFDNKILTPEQLKSLNTLTEKANAFSAQVDSIKGVILSGLQPAKLAIGALGDIIRCGEAVTKAIVDIESAGLFFRNSVNDLSNRLFNLMAFVQNNTDYFLAIFGSKKGSSSLRTYLSPIDPAVIATQTGVWSSPAAGKPLYIDFADKSPILFYEVHPDETWGDISQKFTGSFDNAMALALFNGCADIYSKADGSPLCGGDVVSIPQSSTNAATDAATDNQHTGDVFGTDIAFDFQTGDFMLTSKPFTYWDGANYITDATGKKDLATVSGVTNLKQALLNRMFTTRGSVPSATQYGLQPIATGDPIPQNIVAMLSSDVANQFMQETRLISVQNVKIRTEADKILVDAYVTAIDGKTKIPVVTPSLI